MVEITKILESRKDQDDQAVEDQPTLFPELVSNKSRDRTPPRAGAGRAIGAIGSKRRMIEKILLGSVREAAKYLLDGVRNNDPTCTRIFWDRIYPKPKALTVVDLPTTETPADIRTAMAALLERTVSGEISTDDGQALMSMLKDQLAAHGIRAVEATAEPLAQAADARESLFVKLRTAIERRQNEPEATIQ